MKKKIIVRGPCLTQSGYGEHVRMILRALKQREDLFDIFIVPLNWGQTGWLSGYDDFRVWMDEKIAITQFAIQQRIPFDISIQVSIPNEWERMAPINIGVTAGIETTKVSAIWLQKGNEMDKIIVPSTHAKWSYENTTYQGLDQFGNQMILRLQTPIEVLPYPIRADIVAADSIDDITLANDEFTYLLVGQWGPRKNIENAIKWWVEENWDQDVSLVIKTSFRRNNIMDRDFTRGRIKALLDSIKLDPTEKKCKIYLLHGDMSESEMKALYEHPSIRCMITATHGEGFGLPLFEFAQTGKPIVATGWSAHLDFLTYKDESGKVVNGFLEVDYDLAPIQKEAVWDNVLLEDSMWAFPKEGSFKQRIRQARTKEKKWFEKAALTRQNIENEFKREKIDQLLVKSIKTSLNLNDDNGESSLDSLLYSSEIVEF